MKKFLVIFALALVAMVSCTSKPVTPVAETEDSTEVVMSAVDTCTVTEADSTVLGDSIQ